MTPTRLTIAALLALALVISGCPRSSSSSGDNGSGGSQEFTEALQDAVTLVVEQVVAAGGVFATLNPLTDSRLDLDTIAAIGGFGTCPEVDFAASSTAAALGFDFDSGCTASATGAATVSGSVEVNASRQTGVAEIRFNNLQIDDRRVTGFIDALVQRATDGTALDGTVEVETADVGFLRGDLLIGLGDSGTLTLSATTVRVSDGTTTYDVELTAVMADPINNDNLVPKSGSIYFRRNSIDVVITFSRRSAEDGIVQVAVATASAVNFQAVDITEQ